MLRCFKTFFKLYFVLPSTNVCHCLLTFFLFSSSCVNQGSGELDFAELNYACEVFQIGPVSFSRAAGDPLFRNCLSESIVAIAGQPLAAHKI